jgi:succinoglycan biosynthesis protein ExoA
VSSATATAPPLPPLPDVPRISAFMPARDAATTISDAIASISRQHPPVDEIVVALGPSADDTAAVLDRLQAREPRLRVVDNPSGRIPDGLNAASRACSGDVLVRVDAHSVLPAGYVDAAVRTLRATGAANVGGVQRPVAAHGFARAVAVAMASTVGSGGATYRVGAEPGPADTVFLGVFRRDALEAVGGYDEAFDRNEDAELNLRLQGRGLQVWFTPELAVDYVPRGDVLSLARQYFANGRWRRRTVRTHPASAGLRQLAPAALVLGLAAATLAATVTRRPALTAPVLAYGSALGVAAWRAAPARSDIPGVVVALATMHLSFGAGFLVGPPRPR